MPIKDPEKRKEAQRRAMAKKREAEKKVIVEKGEFVPTKNVYARGWDIIVYPESAPQNWLELLEETRMEIAISPLHDKDINPTTNEVKKAHYHILIVAPGKKSFTQILEITKALNAPIPQVCKSTKGTLRYFTHKDNPEKYQYNSDDIKTLNGFDIKEILKPTTSECMMLQREMIQFCIDYEICEYSDLISYALNNNHDWFEELARSSFMIMNFIKSRRHAMRNPVDPTTGELYESKLKEKEPDVK